MICKILCIYRFTTDNNDNCLSCNTTFVNCHRKARGEEGRQIRAHACYSANWRDFYSTTHSANWRNFYSTSHYHRGTTLFWEKLPALRVTLFQEKLPTLRFMVQKLKYWNLMRQLLCIVAYEICFTLLSYK